MIFLVFASFRAASLNALLTFFMLISLFGFLCMVNSRLSGVRFVLFAKYCLRYLMASCPMKVGDFSCGMFILHGIGGFDSSIFSTCFIWSCFMVCGGSPDCRMTVKNAFSRSLHSLVILLISSFVMALFIFLPLELVVFGYGKSILKVIYWFRKMPIWCLHE